MAPRISAAATRVPVAGTCPDRLVLHRGGEPVWPIADAATRRQLERLAALCGGMLIESLAEDAGGRTSGVPADRAHGDVAAIGFGDIAAARLYAHLTGRAFAGILDLEGGPTADVGVGRFADWSTRLMRWATRPGRAGLQPGLILAGDTAGLVRQVILRSAARRLMAGTRPASHRLVVACDVPVGAIRDGGDILLGGEADGAELDDALAGRPDILTLAIHSDGIDAKLSSDRTLCSRLSQSPDRAASPLLRCLSTGICYRAAMPVAAARAAGRLVPHGRLAAPVIVLDACSILPPSARLAPIAESLGARIVEDCASAAVLLNAEVFTADLRRTIGLSVCLADGAPLGEAIAAFNAPATGQATRRMVLIGDPDIRFAATLREAAPPAAVPAHSVDPAATTPASDTAFARILQAAYARTADASDEGRSAAWLDAIDAVDDLDLATPPRDAVRHPTAVEALVASHIERVFARPTAFLPGLWLPQAILVDAAARIACTACGTVMNATVARFPSGASRRLFAICPHCTGFLDMPADASLKFSTPSERGFALSAEWRGQPAKAVLFAHAPYPEGRRQWLWPRRPNGDLAETFAPPNAPAAPVWMMGVLVSWGLQAASALIPASETSVSAP